LKIGARRDTGRTLKHLPDGGNGNTKASGQLVQPQVSLLPPDTKQRGKMRERRFGSGACVDGGLWHKIKMLLNLLIEI
jgi:hypothetical protein